MRVFISSVVTGFEDYRAAAAAAVGVLRHEVILAERYPATAGSPQQACLQGVRDADVTVVVLGTRYGAIQPSGLSPTHEELVEARNRGVAIVLVQTGINPEPRQAALINEVTAWTGNLVETFSSPNELKEATIRALNRFEVDRSRSRVDVQDLLQKANGMIPASGSGGSPAIALAVVPGPEEQLIRPAELDRFGEEVRREVLAGPAGLFNPAYGTQLSVRDDRVVVAQDHGRGVVVVDAAGAFAAMVSALQEREIGSGVLSIIEEDIRAKLQTSLELAARLLDRSDPMHRSTDVVIAAGLVAGSWLPWRTKAEHAANPHQAAMGRGVLTGGQGTVLVHLTPPRRARGDLGHSAAAIAEDLTALLRQRVRP